MHLPFAFSISHFVSSVGADAGFAAIIGLAVLVLLYFAQARETSTLRDEATAASQRVGELERRVSQLSQPQVAPAPRPAGAAQPSAVAAAAAPPSQVKPLAIPAAPAGVGAPALFSATRLIPALQQSEAAVAAGARVSQASPKIVEAPVPAEAPVPGNAPAPGNAPVPRPAPAQSAPEKAPLPVPGNAPAPAVASAEAAGATALATPPPATAAGGAKPVPAPQPAAAGTNGTGEHPASPPPAAGGAPPRIQIRPGGAVPPGSLSMGGTKRPSRWRRALPVLIAALLVAGVVGVLLVVTSAGGSPNQAGATKSTNAPTARGGAFKPSSVTVAVLNGTNVFQLAHKVAQKLGRTGYRQGAVATAADQTHATTLVGYLPGARRDGLRVAKALGLSPTSVQPVDQTAKTVACPPPGACGANVVVTVGSDLSSTH